LPIWKTLCKMKNIIVTILFLIFLPCINAQDSLRIVNNDTLKFEIKDLSLYTTDSVYSISFELPDCPYNKINAQRDIEKDSMSIIIHGGFTEFGNMDERLSKEFQKKYNVKFVFLGCVRYWNTDSEDTDGYNELIFAHLERKYGSIVDSEYKHLWHNE
jgi:hypothetical protein